MPKHVGLSHAVLAFRDSTDREAVNRVSPFNTHTHTHTHRGRKGTAVSTLLTSSTTTQLFKNLEAARKEM